MVNIKLYEKYHSGLKLHKRIINTDDFTYRNTLSKLQKFIPNKGRILDVGSATGTVSFYFAQKGLKVDGVELSKKAVIYANANKDVLNLKNVFFHNTSVEKFSKNSKYEMVVCFEVLEHIKKDKSTLLKIHDFMNRNSVFVLTVPSKNAPLYRLGLLNNFDKRVGHLRRYSMEEIKTLLEGLGFEIIDSYKSEGVIRSLLFTNQYLGIFVRFTKIKVINNLINYIDSLTVLLFGESQLIVISKIKK